VRSFAFTVALFVAAANAFAQPLRGLTAAAPLSRVYDTIFDARFEQVPAELAKACPPAPAEVCRVLEAVSIWWQIQLDPNNTSRDREFLKTVNAAIDASEAWVEREPDRAEAWFYLGGAYGARVQWRVLRGERLPAARDGKRIKDALEQALALDPDLHDAWFGIGLYHYYADVAPAAAKVLRWLLFLPGGDRVKGLEEMLRARDEGDLLRSEADYQLHILYLWYEDNPQRALELLEALQLRHAENPHFPQLIAEVQDVYKHDLTASLRSWQGLLDAAQKHKVSLPEMAEARARLGIALQLDRLFETDVAIEHLRAVIASHPIAPFGATAQAQLQLGQALDRMGLRDEAVVAYRAAIAASPGHDPLHITEQAKAGLKKKPDAAVANAYRLSIEGWRALEHGDLAAATRLIGQSIELQPRDPVARYRESRLLHAKKDDTGSLRVLDAIIASRSATPPTIYGFACVDAARLLEQRGDRPRAIELYRTARDVFGADQRTKDAAHRALSRLSSLTQSPSRRTRQR
jgi:tetratricopeptide (TPR) repeat protein